MSSHVGVRRDSSPQQPLSLVEWVRFRGKGLNLNTSLPNMCVLVYAVAQVRARGVLELKPTYLSRLYLLSSRVLFLERSLIPNPNLW